LDASQALDDTLRSTLSEAYRLIKRGVTDRRNAMHTPSVATLGLDGRPRIRTVVLRDFDEGAGTLRFHTDRRSEKVSELARDPRIGVHFYDEAAKVQLRIDGSAAIHCEGIVADAAWIASQRMSRVCYGTDPAPGSVIERADAFRLPNLDPEIAAGREHFSAIVVTISAIEWLWLKSGGHRRATFRFRNGAESVESQWLAP